MPVVPPAPEHDPARAPDPAPRPSPELQARRDSAEVRTIRSSGGRGRMVGWRSRDVVRTTALVIGVLLAVKLFWVAHVLFFAVFLGMLFGIAVSGGVDYLQRFRIPRGVGAAVIVFSFLGLLFGVGAWVAPTLREQGAELRQKLPEAVDRVQDWVKKRQSGVLGILVTQEEPDAPTEVGVRPVATTPGASPAPVVGAQKGAPSPDSSAAAKGSGLHDQLRQRMSGMSRYLFPFITSTIETVGGMLLIIFLSIYFAVEPDLYRRGLLSLLPARKRARGVIMMDRIAVVLRKWLLTQLIAMVTMFAVSTVTLLLLHVKAAFALGVLVGFFEFIPTIGPILSAVPGIAMGFLDSPEKAGYVAIAYWGMQFLENHLLIPLLMKNGLRLPPALTVVTQAVMAIVFGFIGLMVAVPLLATVIVMFEMLYLDRLPNDFTGTHSSHDTDAHRATPLSIGAQP
ncbi:MAG: AI-2E family transporter [Gemmatimonadota bacterium]|nr:AI-2E family transporter [Gemmatimonadota bacterium]